MPLPRMTTRRWMVAVAIIAILCVLNQRRRSFASRAAYHESRMVARMFLRFRKYLGRELPGPDVKAELHYRRHPDVGKYVYFNRAGEDMTADEVRASLWHEAMALKYREASRYPWFPVMPDPSMPSKPTDSPEPE
jgi:hypothetical protein